MVELNDIYEVALMVAAGRLSWDLYTQARDFIIFYIKRKIDE